MRNQKHTMKLKQGKKNFYVDLMIEKNKNSIASEPWKQQVLKN